MTNRVEFIEIDILKCQLDYGVAPCTASIPGTGDEKCFNCRNSCQDLDNINESTEIVRYSKPSTNLRFDLDATPNITLPNISSINYAPPQLKLGQGIGVRASITVNFIDSPSPDTDASGDKYLADRNYDPYSQGTYWGKFRARYPSLKSQSLRWIVGTDEQQIADMETRNFVIDKVAGPTTSGMYTVVAKDILRLTGGDQSVAPEITGLDILADITDSYTGSLVTIPDTDPLVLRAPGYLSLSGTEAVTYSAASAGGGMSTISINSRGELNTLAVSHKEGSAIQRILEYFGENASDIFYDLLTEYAGIDGGDIPLIDWQTEDADYINRSYTAYIAEPTAVETLMNELINQTASTMWWDNLAQLIRWQVLRNPSASAFNYDDRVTRRGSFNISDGDYSQRASRIYVYYGQVNPLLPLGELDNYSGRVLRTEIESEAFFGNTAAYRTITSRWIAAAARDTAERLGDLILQRFSLPPRKVGFKLLRDTAIEIPELGGSYNASNFELQDFAGRATSLPIQITGLVPSNVEYTVQAEEITFNSVIVPDDPNVVPISIAFNQLNVNLRTLYDAIAPAPTAATIVNATIESGVAIGSSSPSLFALESGNWPAGVTLNLVNNGLIVGRGGDAGEGSAITSINLVAGFNPNFHSSYTDATDGGDGGDSIRDTYGINLTNNGTIGGGGGGGGGSSSAYGILTYPAGSFTRYFGYSAGGGGGGGAGNISGSGGSSGSVSNVNVFSGSKAPTYTAPPSATSGSLTAGGAGTGGFSQNNVDGLGINYVLIGCIAGSGGDLGQSGQAGSNTPSSTPSPGSYPGYNVVDSPLGLTGSGGAAGNAIVQSGATTNIIVTGTILGAIV